MRILISRTLFFLSILCLVVPIGLGDEPDHPLLSRYPGSKVVSKDVKQFDDLDIPVSPYSGEKFAKTEHIEGKITYFRYDIPENRTSLEVIRNYEQGLQKAGFQILFRCSQTECGAKESPSVDLKGIGRWCIQGLDCNANDPMRYVAAKLARKAGDIYVAVKAMPFGQRGTYTGTFVVIAEAKPMESGMVKVDSAAMSADIAREGHEAIYGITFDTDRADIRRDSASVLGEIAKLCKANPSLKLHVVGHTDNSGSFAHNMDLSKRRAAAVVNALVTQYQVAAARLQPSGVASLAPVATNRTEEGRAKNRRVELVEQ